MQGLLTLGIIVEAITTQAWTICYLAYRYAQLMAIPTHAEGYTRLEFHATEFQYTGMPQS